MFVVLTCMTFGLSPIAMGQIYSSEYLYYHSDQSDVMVIIKFEGSSAICRSSGGFDSEKAVRNHLKNDSRWYEREYNIPKGRDELKYEYCSEESSYDWIVYKRKWSSMTTQCYVDGFEVKPVYNTGYCYIAVSKDKKKILKWCDSDSKDYFSLVNKDFYLPKDEFYNE